MPSTLAQNKYQVIAGIHFEPKDNWHGAYEDPKRIQLFKTGEIVISSRPLDEIFVNKFRKLSDEESAPVFDRETRTRDVDTMIASGLWQEGDRNFLEKIAQENFERIRNRISEAVSAASVSNVEGKVSSILGEDVTSLFQRAYDCDFKVFRSGNGKYQVTSKADVNKPINKEPLTEKSVDTFVDRFLKEK
jgi:hypothetical protein